MTVTLVSGNNEQELLATLNELTKRRNEHVAQWQKQIDEMNVWYDNRAVPIKRELERLRASQPAAKRSRRAPRSIHSVMVLIDGHGYDPEWCDEDIQHFQELAVKRV